jgi:hypothetical protein
VVSRWSETTFISPLGRFSKPLLQNGCAADAVEFLTKLPYSFDTPPTLAELARRQGRWLREGFDLIVN